MICSESMSKGFPKSRLGLELCCFKDAKVHSSAEIRKLPEGRPKSNVTEECVAPIKTIIHRLCTQSVSFVSSSFVGGCDAAMPKPILQSMPPSPHCDVELKPYIKRKPADRPITWCACAYVGKTVFRLTCNPSINASRGRGAKHSLLCRLGGAMLGPIVDWE